jgi:hypothetical protein
LFSLSVLIARASLTNPTLAQADWRKNKLFFFPGSGLIGFAASLRLSETRKENSRGFRNDAVQVFNRTWT